MKLIYLAQPYANEDEVVRNDRIEASDYYGARIIELGHAVFAPISQGPRLARHLAPQTADDNGFWMRQDLRILCACTELWLLPLQGWEFSKGVAKELGTCRLLDIPVTIIQDVSNTLVDYVRSPVFELNYGIKAEIVCL